MSTGSKIEWTEVTWNPTVGCAKVSPGCDNCYAIRTAARFQGSPAYAGTVHRGQSGLDWTGTVNSLPDRLDAPLHWQEPRRIFVNSMSDLFHDDVPDEFIARVWQIMGTAPHHTYQLLTKRHGRMRSWVRRWYAGDIPEPYDVRPVVGYPGYSVTTTGQVLGKRSDTRAGLTEDVGEHGHRRVTMHREESGSSGERELVHRVVLTAFVRPARPGEQACHRNGDPSDNRLSNLYWGSQQDNWRDRIAHGNGQSYAKLSSEQVEVIRSRSAAGESAYAIAKDFSVSDTQIRNIQRGNQWSTAQVATVARKPCRAVLSSVWLGVSVEDQHWADIRIPALLDTPAAVRWISAEPLLGPVDLTPFVMHQCDCDGPAHAKQSEYGPALDWVVVGGESGPGARPMHPDWARQLRDQCKTAGVPYFFKQWGSWRWVAHSRWDDATTCWVDDGIEPQRAPKKLAGRLLDGRTWDEYPQTAMAVTA